MYIGQDGKLHYKHEGRPNDPHQNRMNAIFASKSTDNIRQSTGSNSMRGGYYSQNHQNSYQRHQ